MDLLSILIITLSLLPFIALHVTRKYIYFALLSLSTIVLHAIYLFGFQVILLIFITYIVSTVIELISLKTRFNFFGVKYRYELSNLTFSSGINYLGVYPIEVSITWVIFKYLSFSIALLIISAFSFPYLIIILLIPFILVSLDFIVDPVAVNKYKMWKWEKGSKYFGIPYSNFIGWFLVGFISSLTLIFVEVRQSLSFNYLFLLPLIFYALIVRNSVKIYKVDKMKTILGIIPAATWVILGVISIIILT